MKVLRSALHADIDYDRVHGHLGMGIVCLSTFLPWHGNNLCNSKTLKKCMGIAQVCFGLASLEFVWNKKITNRFYSWKPCMSIDML